MKKERNYHQDITEIRSMMERSSKFMSLSGWAGILAGLYALAGAFLAYYFLGFNPQVIKPQSPPYQIDQLILTGSIVLLFAICSTIYFSYKKALQREEKIWNPTSRRVISHMAIPMLVGGIFILIMISKDLFGLVAPLSLIFYGFALYNTSKYTFEEIKVLGFTLIFLGLFSTYFIHLGLLSWALGFGVAHIIYGLYLHYKYEK